MSDAPTRPIQPYRSFEDPPPRAACTDALLGRVIRRLLMDSGRHEDGLAGVLQAVLATLDQGAMASGKSSR